MVTITASDLDTLLNLDSDVPDATLEAIIDLAVDKLNLYLKGKELSNMAGTAGSKTLSVESRERGAIIPVAIAIYNRDYKLSGSESTSTSLGPMSTASSISGNVTSVEALAEKAADELKELEVDFG